MSVWVLVCRSLGFSLRLGLSLPGPAVINILGNIHINIYINLLAQPACATGVGAPCYHLLQSAVPVPRQLPAPFACVRVSEWVWVGVGVSGWARGLLWVRVHEHVPFNPRHHRPEPYAQQDEDPSLFRV